jgi:hypothetical protein
MIDTEAARCDGGEMTRSTAEAFVYALEVGYVTGSTDRLREWCEGQREMLSSLTGPARIRYDWPLILREVVDVLGRNDD